MVVGSSHFRVMESQNVLEEELDFSSDRPLLASVMLEESENAGVSDSYFYEKFILEDMDTYWDDLNTRLIVSRMVNDAIVKGIVSAVVQEAADETLSKEAKVALLSERLRFNELDAYGDKKSGTLQAHDMGPKFQLRSIFGDNLMERNHEEQLHYLKDVADQQLAQLKNGIEGMKSFMSMTKLNMASENAESRYRRMLLENLENLEENYNGLTETLDSLYQEIGDSFFLFNNSLSEQELEWDIQKEVVRVFIENHIEGLRKEIGEKIERKVYVSQNKNYSKVLDKLTSLRNELNAFNMSLSNSEPGWMMLPNNPENTKWSANCENGSFSCKVMGNHLSCSSHTQGNGKTPRDRLKKSVLEVFESPLLSHLSREELINHFKSEVTKMNMNHEVALQQKTEELFKAKRELLRKKGSLPFKKDKELEILRKKIPEFLAKLDDIILEDEPLSTENNDAKLSNCADRPTFENLHFRDLLVDNEDDIEALLAQVSEAGSTVSEAIILNLIKKLQGSIDDLKVEENLRDEILNFVLKAMINEINWSTETSKMEYNFNLEIYKTIVQAFIGDVKSSINALIREHSEQKEHLEAINHAKHKSLSLEVEKTNKLKNDITSLLQMMVVKEKSAQEAELRLMQNNKQHEFFCQELNMFKEKVQMQEMLISQSMRDIDLLNSRLQKANVQLVLSENVRSKQDEVFKDVSTKLIEANKQNAILHGNDEQKEKRIQALILEKRQQEERVKSLAFCVLSMFKVLDDSGNHVAEHIQIINSRLQKLNHENGEIAQQAEFLQKERSLLKQCLQTKSLNLQKAEMEVDLLGDEVDALMSVLVKVYVALEHYSPVFQHYPGVVEILKLVKKELERTANAKPIKS